LSKIRSESFAFCINLTAISTPASVSVNWTD
jgi:hypothetical protein